MLLYLLEWASCRSWKRYFGSNFYGDWKEIEGVSKNHCVARTSSFETDRIEDIAELVPNPRAKEHWACGLLGRISRSSQDGNPVG